MSRIAALLSRLPKGEILRYGITGIVATLTHFLALTLAVEILSIPAAIANGLAFATAVLVTYFGQSYWVFRQPSRSLAQLKKFLATALGGLFANIGIMALAVNVLALPYQVGFVTALLVVPATTFVVSKFWVFAGGVQTVEMGHADGERTGR